MRLKEKQELKGKLELKGNLDLRVLKAYKVNKELKGK